MSPLFFAFLTYFGWGTGDIFGIISARKIGVYSTTFWVFASGLLLFSAYIPFAFSDLGKLTLPLLLFNLFLGLFYVGGNILINESLTISNASVNGTIIASFSALVILLSTVFFHERVAAEQLLAIIIIFIGVILTTLNFKELSNGKLFHDRGTVIAIAAMLTQAIYFTFIKIVMGQIGWFWPNYISFALFPLIFLFMKAKKMKLVAPKSTVQVLPILISALLLRGGDFVFNYGIGNGFAAIVAPIGGAYPTLFAVLAFFVFRDPMKKQQFFGIITTLIGIVLLSVFSR